MEIYLLKAYIYGNRIEGFWKSVCCGYTWYCHDSYNRKLNLVSHKDDVMGDHRHHLLVRGFYLGSYGHGQYNWYNKKCRFDFSFSSSPSDMHEIRHAIWKKLSLSKRKRKNLVVTLNKFVDNIKYAAGYTRSLSSRGSGSQQGKLYIFRNLLADLLWESLKEYPKIYCNLASCLFDWRLTVKNLFYALYCSNFCVIFSFYSQLLSGWK